MHWRKIAGLVLLGLGLAATAVAAARATLADAAEQRDKTSVRTLLETGADVNAAQVDGTTALHWAAYNDDAETVALLVQRRRQCERREPLWRAAAGTGMYQRQRCHREAVAGGWSRRERHDEGRGNRPHAGCALRECRGGEGAARARRQHQDTRTARPDGLDVGGGRRAHRRRPRAARCRSRHQREDRFRVYAVLLCRARGPSRYGARVSRGGRRCECDDAASAENAPAAQRGGGASGAARTGTNALTLAVQNGHFELGDCAGRRGRRSERCANRIHSAPHDCRGAKAGFKRHQRCCAADRVGPPVERRLRARNREARRERQSSPAQRHAASSPTPPRRSGPRGRRRFCLPPIAPTFR